MVAGMKILLRLLLVILLLPALHVLAAPAHSGMGAAMSAMAQDSPHRGHCGPPGHAMQQRQHDSCAASTGHADSGCTTRDCAGAGCLQACAPSLPGHVSWGIAALPAASPLVPARTTVFASIYLTPPHRPPALV